MDKEKTADELIEEGLALVAKGISRKGDVSADDDPKAAYESSMAIIDVVRGMALDFRAIAIKKGQMGVLDV